MDTKAGIESLKEAFVAKILPVIERHARVVFRYLGPEARQEAQQNMATIAWSWALRISESGRDPTTFASTIADLAAKHHRAGRGIAGGQRSRDVMSPIARQRHGFTVSTLPDYSTLSPNPLQLALIDNTQTPPDEAACFRLDFGAWLDSWGERDRQLIVDLGMGERTADAAAKRGLSCGRISQKRRHFERSWSLYQAA